MPTGSNYVEDCRKQPQRFVPGAARSPLQDRFLLTARVHGSRDNLIQCRDVEGPVEIPNRHRRGKLGQLDKRPTSLGVCLKAKRQRPEVRKRLAAAHGFYSYSVRRLSQKYNCSNRHRPAITAPVNVESKVNPVGPNSSDRCSRRRLAVKHVRTKSNARRAGKEHGCRRWSETRRILCQ